MRVAVFFGELFLALMVGACGAQLPRVPAAPLMVDNDPIPLPADLEPSFQQYLSDNGRRLEPADQTPPPITAEEAREIAGRRLVESLRSNDVPDQDPSIAHGLIRRRLVDPARPPTAVWIVVYRWIAGFDCHTGAGGPGPCPTASYYVIDDRSGEVITGVILTS